MSSIPWRSLEELIQIGFTNSRVVMMNEAHSGLQRCVRTRQIGQRTIPIAHQLGVRYLAMEALNKQSADHANTHRYLPHTQGDYLAQPEMLAFIQAALDHQWTLIAYEANSFTWLYDRFGIPADLTPEQIAPYLPALQSPEYTNWREAQQAQNLVIALDALPTDARMLVWCGNGHLARAASDEWQPMGFHFERLNAFPAFTIDQITTVLFDDEHHLTYSQDIIQSFGLELQAWAGTAGFLAKECSDEVGNPHDADAILLSLFNDLE